MLGNDRKGPQDHHGYSHQDEKYSPQDEQPRATKPPQTATSTSLLQPLPRPPRKLLPLPADPDRASRSRGTVAYPTSTTGGGKGSHTAVTTGRGTTRRHPARMRTSKQLPSEDSWRQAESRRTWNEKRRPTQEQAKTERRSKQPFLERVGIRKEESRMAENKRFIYRP